jgi:Fe-S cluster biogenesis protein NfuA
MNPVTVSLEFTPNPNTLKFLINQPLLPKGAANFTAPDQTEKSPLAQKLFAIAGVGGVLIGTNFVTITKAETGNWDVLADEVPKTIENHLTAGQPVVSADWNFETPVQSSDIIRRIQEVLDADIRPAVAMDGGDITFGKFEDGIVYLHLQGSCSSCPSSIMTLKMGVENRLKEIIPEVKEVVQI